MEKRGYMLVSAKLDSDGRQRTRTSMGAAALARIHAHGPRTGSLVIVGASGPDETSQRDSESSQPRPRHTPQRHAGRFLITTALEETWRSDQPVLWLGEWCRRYSRQAHWSRLDSTVLPYHWDDRIRMQADYQQLLRLQESILPVLGGQLNEIHGTDHGDRYWRILIGPWLGYFSQMLFDRWCSIQQATRRHRITETVVLTGGEEKLVPLGMTDFVRLFVSDEWNHHLYATILQEFTDVPCVHQQRRTDSFPAANAASCKHYAENAAIRAYARVAGILGNDTDAFFLTTYLPPAVERDLCRRLGQLPLRWPTMPAVETPVDEKWRRWELAGRSRSDFESCLRALIPRQIPTAYLEGYRRLIEQTEHLPWPKRPKVIWTSNAQTRDELFKAWAALRVQEGAPLAIGQHGGGYGSRRWGFAEDHEIAISDRFLSWGWTEPSTPKVTPVAQFTAGPKSLIDHSKQRRALMISFALPRYSYGMYSSPTARQWLDYSHQQITFVERLPAAIRDMLTIRLYPQDFGWDQIDRWRDRFPHLHIDNGRGPIDALIRRSRLCISTYNSTAYLESFSKAVPTVLFWDPVHWELRSSAVPYFDDLRRVGIFHETPESAAEHVGAIWDNVDAWWTSSRTREARERFTARFSGPTGKMLDRLEGVLREVMTDPRRMNQDART